MGLNTNKMGNYTWSCQVFMQMPLNEQAREEQEKVRKHTDKSLKIKHMSNIKTIIKFSNKKLIILIKGIFLTKPIWLNRCLKIAVFLIRVSLYRNSMWHIKNKIAVAIKTITKEDKFQLLIQEGKDITILIRSHSGINKANIINCNNNKPM